MESLVLAMVLQPSVTVTARSLLGRKLRGHGVTVRITEVEAYAGPDDPASHAFTRTARSDIMYGPADRLYVYRIHGHHCANVVSGPDGEASAVLLRAGAVTDGLELARRRRGTHVLDEHLARGPGNLCAALGITMNDLGVDLDGPSSVRLLPVDLPTPGLTTPAPPLVSEGPRVGVRRAADRPWRFWITGDRSVSAFRRHPRAETEPS
ncbi:DNA-3-methyladenine glycosylase [Gordonia sp. NPDC003425]